MRPRREKLRHVVIGVALSALLGSGLTVAAAVPSTAAQHSSDTWTVNDPGRSTLSAQLDLDSAGELHPRWTAAARRSCCRAGSDSAPRSTT